MTRGILIDSAHQVRRTQYAIWVYFAVPLGALLIQVYLPLFRPLQFIRYIELPLMATIYFAVMSRSQLNGLLMGMLLGLAQDSLFYQKLGMYGISKTMVGYFSASVGLQVDVENSFVRVIITFVFYLFHQFLYWVLQHGLLDQAVPFNLERELLLALINAVIAMLVYFLLDKLRRKE